MADSMNLLMFVGKNPEVIDPYGNYLVVEVFKTSKESAGGIVLPDAMVERDKQALAWLIKAGPGMRTMDRSAHIGTYGDPGDLLVVLKHGPVEMTIGGEKFHVMAEGDVVGKVNIGLLAKKAPELAEELKAKREEILAKISLGNSSEVDPLNKG